MDTLLHWINSNELNNFRNYIRSLNDVNSVLIYDDEVNLNILHIISASDSLYRNDALRCLLEENKKSIDKPKLNINQKSGPGNDYWTACHLACCYGNLSTLEILLQNGADPKIIDKNGLDAIQVATAYDQYRCVELIRRMVKSNIFSKADLNKSCDTVFCSFKNELIIDGFESEEKHNRLQTSGKLNNVSDVSKLKLSDFEKKKIPDELRYNNNLNVVSSASKVIDRYRKDLDGTRVSNSRLINENDKSNLYESLDRTIIENEIEKNSSLFDFSAVRLPGKKINENQLSSFNKSSIVIKNLRKNVFKNCEINETSDDSIELFDGSISTITLSETKTLYIDNEFQINFINESKPGLLDKLKLNNSKLISKIEGKETENLTSINDLKKNDLNDDTFICDKKASYSLNYDLLSNSEIFEELIKLGQKPGPINANTRFVYIKKLQEINLANNAASQFSKLNNRITSLNNCMDAMKIEDNTLMFPKALRELMTGKFDFKLARQVEMEFEKNFENEGTSCKKFFNYLLLDPRITQNLCQRALDNNPQLLNRLDCSKECMKLSDDDRINYHSNLALFKLFILAIFYIGKGQGNRPFMHLYDAEKFKQNSHSKKKSNIMKLNKIKEVWESGLGVISLHCFHNRSSIESLTRECLMIDTIGIKFLTNIRIGQNQIKNLKWTQYKKDVLGAYFLYKAYNILLLNGEKQIKRADI